jgi:hypothetical protein
MTLGPADKVDVSAEAVPATTSNNTDTSALADAKACAVNNTKVDANAEAVAATTSNNTAVTSTKANGDAASSTDADAASSTDADAACSTDEAALLLVAASALPSASVLAIAGAGAGASASDNNQSDVNASSSTDADAAATNKEVVTGADIDADVDPSAPQNHPKTTSPPRPLDLTCTDLTRTLGEAIAGSTINCHLCLPTVVPALYVRTCCVSGRDQLPPTTLLTDTPFIEDRGLCDSCSLLMGDCESCGDHSIGNCTALADLLAAPSATTDNEDTDGGDVESRFWRAKLAVDGGEFHHKKLYVR